MNDIYRPINWDEVEWFDWVCPVCENLNVDSPQLLKVARCAECGEVRHMDEIVPPEVGE